MARRRDSKGRFVSTGRKSKSRRSRGKGMGSIITVKRAGMGQLDADTLLPPAVGGGLAGLTTLALRMYVDPAQGSTQQALVKYAPVFGMAAGSLASLGLFLLNRDTTQAWRSFVSATLISVFGFGSDFILREKGGSVLAAVTAPMDLMGAGAGAGGNGTAGYRQMGAIVPEYSNGMGALVMEPVGSSGQRPGTIGSYGETVQLQGVNISAFGTPGFTA